MIIKNMFSKPIDRDIKGVIKVGQDDDANIKQELEEYVVTRELQKHFSDFFASAEPGFGTTAYIKTSPRPVVIGAISSTTPAGTLAEALIIFSAICWRAQ